MARALHGHNVCAEISPKPLSGLNFQIEDSEKFGLAIGWKGHYRIEGVAFIYVDRDSGRVSTTLGYPTHKLIQIE
jgi:hypothetical protein